MDEEKNNMNSGKMKGMKSLDLNILTSGIGVYREEIINKTFQGYMYTLKIELQLFIKNGCIVYNMDGAWLRVRA